MGPPWDPLGFLGPPPAPRVSTPAANFGASEGRRTCAGAAPGAVGAGTGAPSSATRARSAAPFGAEIGGLEENLWVDEHEL